MQNEVEQSWEEYLSKFGDLDGNAWQDTDCFEIFSAGFNAAKRMYKVRYATPEELSACMRGMRGEFSGPIENLEN